MKSNIITLLLIAACACAFAQNGNVGINTSNPRSTLEINGSLATGYKTLLSSASLDSTYGTVSFTGSSAATLTLPAAATCKGRSYAVKNMSTPLSALTIATTGGQTIDGNATWTLGQANEAATFTSNGSNWEVYTQAIPGAAGSAWVQGGNALGTAKNIGTTTNHDLPFITNNTEKMRLTSSGNMGVGTSAFNGTNPEKLLVDAGTTASVNAMVGKGTIDSYLQLNIQNLSAGTSASADVVATADNGSEITNFIDMGVNGSAYSAGVMGSANDAYLYNIGQNMLIGTGTAAKSLVFMTGGTSLAGNERMRITGTGNVGIGNTAPAYKLDVNGAIHTGKPSTSNGSLVFSNNTNNNSVTINSGIAASTYSLTLPTDQGGAGTQLTNNGSGVLVWNTAAAAGGAWGNTGNAGTSPAVNFLGTTDNQALAFRVNNIASGKIETSVTANTAFGYESGLSNTGTANTSFGSHTLMANTSGVNNTAIGSSALKANITGTGNTGIGANALTATTGSSNTAVGSFAMQNNAAGSNNVALGYSTLSNNTTGTGNTASGSAALQSNLSGLNNTAIGNGAIQLNSAGSSNTGMGAFALQNNTGGSNTGLGYGALSATLTGNNNTALGYQAGNTNTTGGNNTFLGYQADASSAGLTNATAIGYNAKVASSNTLVLGGTGANAVNVGIGSTSFDATNPEKVLIDAGVTTSVNALYAKGTINKYFKVNIQNLSTGTQSSSELVATSNNGTESTNFVDLGINGSGFVYQAGNPIETGKANDGYLISAGNDFYVVNNNVAKDVIFLTGGTATTNEAMRITSAKKIGIGTAAPQALLDVSGTYKLGTSGTVLTNMAKTSAAVSDATMFNNSSTHSVTVTVTGANPNATVLINPRSALPAGIAIAWSHVSSANTVTIGFINSDFVPRAIGSITLDITIIE